MRARLLRIEGKVQGVFYRESMRREAERLGVAGWVRNRADYSVEALIQATREDALEALEAWAKQGPPSAQVSKVTSTNTQPEPGLARFERRETI